MVGFSCRGKVIIAAVLLYSVPGSTATPLVAHLAAQNLSFNTYRFSTAEQVVEPMQFNRKSRATKNCRYTRLQIERLEPRQMFAISPLHALSLPGDYNQDAIVDGADYVSWRKAQNTNAALPNDLSPQNVGEDDRDVWRTQFGEVLDSPPSPGLPGDYNQDAIVDGADYVSWRKAQNTSAALLPNDLTPETVGEDDRNVWRMQFGEVLDNNWMPMVWAGDDATSTSPTFDLSGEIIINNPLNPSISWSQVSGTGTASFVDASSENTAVVFSDAGVYELQLTVTNHGVVASDFVTVTVEQAAVGQPELPRELLNTTLDPSYNRPADIVVRAGDNLQAALDSAQPGQIIELEAGAAFTGNFVLRNKPGDAWIYIRTSGYANLPAAGTRVTPAQASLMSKIVSANSAPAIATEFGAHNYRLIGIEVTATYSLNYCLIQLGYNSSGGEPATSISQLPHHITFDRMYIHGTPTGDMRRGIALNSTHTAVIDSYLSDFHEVGADSQAIFGYNGNGPFKIVNNYLEAAGENILFGGADPAIANLVPSDIEIRGNHFYKPLSWKIDDPSYAGTPWTVKNLFELKNAQRVLIDGNVFENNWPHGQTGFAILFTPRNQDGGAPWSTIEDVTFRKNVVRNTSSGIQLLSSDYLGTGSLPIRRISIEDNLVICDINKFGGDGRLFQLSAGPIPASHIKIVHNTLIHAGPGNTFISVGDQGTFANDFIFQDNISTFGSYGFHSPAGAGKQGMEAFLGTYTFDHNAMIVNGAFVVTYPDGNFFPTNTAAVGFVDIAAGNYRLSSGSPFKTGAHDGKSLGADIDAIMAAIADVAALGSGSTTQFLVHGNNEEAGAVIDSWFDQDSGKLLTYRDLRSSFYSSNPVAAGSAVIGTSTPLVSLRLSARDNLSTLPRNTVSQPLSDDRALEVTIAEDSSDEFVHATTGVVDRVFDAHGNSVSGQLQSVELDM